MNKLKQKFAQNFGFDPGPIILSSFLCLVYALYQLDLCQFFLFRLSLFQDLNLASGFSMKCLESLLFLDLESF